MNLDEYQQLAKRTAKHPDPNADMYELMALGLIGETGEVVDLIKKHKYHGVPVDVEKLKKEVGDCLWYFVNTLTLFRETTAIIPVYEVRRPSPVRLGYYVGDFADDVFDEVYDVSNAGMILAHLRLIANAHGFTLEDAADANIEKLKRRYPDGFDLARAANHDSE